jgi:uncharacterized protein (DUF4415 family)
LPEQSRSLEIFPELAKTINRRWPHKAPTKMAVNIRLSPVVLEQFRSLGPGWQTKTDDTLMRVISREAKRKI